MFSPKLSEISSFAKDYKLIPISCEIYADTETPISIYQKLKTDNNCFLLESFNEDKTFSRYSYIGRNPFLIIKTYENKIITTDFNGVSTEQYGDPLKYIEEICDKYKSPIINGFNGFSGGAVGYFSYDTVRLTEELPNIPKDDLEIPDMYFMFADEIIAYDHLKQKLIVFVNMRTDGDINQNYNRATKRINQIKSEISSKKSNQHEEESINYRETLEIESNMSKEEFCSIVQKAKEYINNGDIFQVVLAQRYHIKTSISPFQVYRALRVINPSPYMYYLSFDDHEIVGASPERLVCVEKHSNKNIVKTCPIAGTRKRGSTDIEDEQIISSLLQDPKEIAEHNMLVDLGRNDIGKVSKFGSVSVKRYKYIKKFSHMIHILSDVEGELTENHSRFDALRAILPAGTLSGAPKVRAMQIIDELETVKRNCYGGSVAYIGFNGSFDSCITIRTALFKDNTAYIGAGAGIVYDSIPENEYNESKNKAMAMFCAISEAGEIIWS